MKKCLVTKLNGVVDNDSLLKIGEMRVGFVKVANPETNIQAISVGVSEPTILKIVGDGYFTDETLSENKGKQITVGENPIMSVYAVFVSNNDTQVSIQNKYNIRELNGYYSSNASSSNLIVINLDDLKYSSLLTSIVFPYAQVLGDISALKNLTALTSISLSSTQVSGDISALKNLTALTSISLSSTQVSGDISALKNLTALTSIS
ncbi:MAG: leucine-rich repeat domain-containing protein, partial [Erysipelotrichaceae bacterium]|nr:leucine-rich repeat domain-containing protein [Erysipelotrichaceae bacterium]